MGVAIQLAPMGSNPPMDGANVNHMGVNVLVLVDQAYVTAISDVGYLPQAGLAALFRRLLALNLMMNPKIGIVENNVIRMTLMLPFDGLSQTQFRWMLDALGSAYWQFVAPLIQEFQLPTQPA